MFCTGYIYTYIIRKYSFKFLLHENKISAILVQNRNTYTPVACSLQPTVYVIETVEEIW